MAIIGWKFDHKDVLPFIAMVTMVCSHVALTILFKAASSRGLSNYVFIVYSYAIATVILFPLTFIFRRRELPPFKLSHLLKIFILGLIGVLAVLCIYKGIKCSSPTLASAISTLSPALVFILAVVFSMERLTLRSRSTQAKAIGTLVSILGALVMILYKGPTILSPTSIHFLRMPENEWIKGGLLLGIGYLLFSVWVILQTHITKTYPDELVLAFLYNLCAVVISSPVCFMAETNSSAWRLKSDITLVTIIYSGVFGSALDILVKIWGMHVKGPVYITSFKPLSILVAAACGFIFLGDDLYLGSVVGAAILSIGFYAVLWGKANEEISEDCGSGLPNAKAPLLGSYKVENM